MKIRHDRILFRNKRREGFTLVELLVVVAIIGLLVSLSIPEYGKFIDRSRSAACMGNLRQVGLAVGFYMNDHEGKFPFINNPANPVYTSPDDIPTGVPPVTMAEAFGPYGVSGKVLRCPSDVLFNDRFDKEGSSYEWRPMLDGEEKVNPEIYTRHGTIRTPRLSGFRLVFDTDPVHAGRQNLLYADGSVRMFK